MEYNGFEIVGDGTYGMKYVKAIGRGSVPKQLRGSYSSLNEARKAIDGVVSERELNGKGSSKAVSTD